MGDLLSYIFIWVMLYVVISRLSELCLSHYNTKRLLQQGAQSHHDGHYKFIILCHAGWIISLLILTPMDSHANMLFLLLFIMVQILRYWVLWTLGRYWTTRIISLPNAPLVKKGIYRYIKHPNYMVVVLEFMLLPSIFAQYEIAIIFSLLNGCLLFYRIKCENKVLALRAKNHY